MRGRRHFRIIARTRGFDVSPCSGIIVLPIFSISMNISLTVISLLKDECFLHLDAAFVLIVLIKLGIFCNSSICKKAVYIEFNRLT